MRGSFLTLRSATRRCPGELHRQTVSREAAATSVGTRGLIPGFDALYSRCSGPIRSGALCGIGILNSSFPDRARLDVTLFR